VSNPVHDPEKKLRWMFLSVRDARKADFREGGKGRVEGVKGSGSGNSSSSGGNEERYAWDAGDISVYFE